MSINVAVYGTLRAGEGNHRLMSDAKFLGDDETKGIMHSLGGFPAVDIDGEGKIKIEVYVVDENTFRRLDGLEGYPHFYNRSEVDTQFGKAWMYHIDAAQLAGRPVITSGDWKEYVKGRK